MKALWSREPGPLKTKISSRRSRRRGRHSQGRWLVRWVPARRYSELQGSPGDMEIRLISGKREAKSPSLGVVTPRETIVRVSVKTDLERRRQRWRE